MIQLPKALVPFFWHFIKKQPIAFLVFFLSPLVIILETNVMPYALKMLIDAISDYQGNKSAIIKEIAPALWLGSSAWFGLIIIMRLQQWWQAYAIPLLEAEIRTSVLNYVILHSHSYFSDNPAGNIANKISDLPRAIESIRSILCWNGISIFAVVFVTLIMMAAINIWFSLILGLWVITHLIITLYFVRFVNEASKENAEDKSILSGTIVDIISNINSIKLFARYSYELGYAGNKQYEERLSNSRLLVKMNVFQLCMDIPVTLMLGSTLYLLIISWQQETVSTGDVIFIFNMIFAVVYQMWHLGHALATLFCEIGVVQQALTLVTCPHQVINIPEARTLEVTRGKIIFNNVTFYYNKGYNIFEKENIIIEPNQKVGLVGFSGSGKSTFVNLILRFFDIEKGIITIDDQDISKVTQESLRANIAMIPQDISLFHRTLIENIRYGRISATDQEVVDASKKAYCHEFITKLPNGYDSLVGERGIKLSGGQRQRIAIARAILKNAPILILDEATSALDSVTEKYIQRSLHKLIQGRTTIVIAHRISTLSAMDRILVFDNGHVVEDGTHIELLKAKGHYAFMYKMHIGEFLPNNAK